MFKDTLTWRHLSGFSLAAKRTFFTTEVLQCDRHSRWTVPVIPGKPELLPFWVDILSFWITPCLGSALVRHRSVTKVGIWLSQTKFMWAKKGGHSWDRKMFGDWASHPLLSCLPWKFRLLHSCVQSVEKLLQGAFPAGGGEGRRASSAWNWSHHRTLDSRCISVAHKLILLATYQSV